MSCFSSVLDSLTSSGPCHKVADSPWTDGERLKNFAKMARVGDEVVIRNDSFTHVKRAFVVAAEPALDTIALRVWHETNLEPAKRDEETHGLTVVCKRVGRSRASAMAR